MPQDSKKTSSAKNANDIVPTYTKDELVNKMVGQPLTKEWDVMVSYTESQLNAFVIEQSYKGKTHPKDPIMRLKSFSFISPGSLHVPPFFYQVALELGLPRFEFLESGNCRFHLPILSGNYHAYAYNLDKNLPQPDFQSNDGKIVIQPDIEISSDGVISIGNDRVIFSDNNIIYKADVNNKEKQEEQTIDETATDATGTKLSRIGSGTIAITIKDNKDEKTGEDEGKEISITNDGKHILTITKKAFDLETSPTDEIRMLVPVECLQGKTGKVSSNDKVITFDTNEEKYHTIINFSARVISGEHVNFNVSDEILTDPLNYTAIREALLNCLSIASQTNDTSEGKKTDDGDDKESKGDGGEHLIHYKLAGVTNLQPSDVPDDEYILVPQSFRFSIQTNNADDDAQSESVLMLGVQTAVLSEKKKDEDGNDTRTLLYKGSQGSEAWTFTDKEGEELMPVPKDATTSIFFSGNMVAKGILTPQLDKTLGGDKYYFTNACGKEPDGSGLNVKITSLGTINVSEFSYTSQAYKETDKTTMEKFAITPDVSLKFNMKTTDFSVNTREKFTYKYVASFASTFGSHDDDPVNYKNNFFSLSWTKSVNFKLSSENEIKSDVITFSPEDMKQAYKLEFEHTPPDEYKLWSHHSSGADQFSNHIGNFTFPTVELKLPGFNYFQETNLLFPGVNVFNVDADFGLATPYDFVLFGNFPDYTEIQTLHTPYEGKIEKPTSYTVKGNIHLTVHFNFDDSNDTKVVLDVLTANFDVLKQDSKASKDGGDDKGSEDKPITDQTFNLSKQSRISITLPADGHTDGINESKLPKDTSGSNNLLFFKQPRLQRKDESDSDYQTYRSNYKEKYEKYVLSKSSSVSFTDGMIPDKISASDKDITFSGKLVKDGTPQETEKNVLQAAIEDTLKGSTIYKNSFS